MSRFLITGTAGFIGFHVAHAILEQGDDVVGLDNINDYYNINLKYARLEKDGIEKDKIQWSKLTQSIKWPNYQFIRLDLYDKKGLWDLFRSEKFDYVIHLAAQAGVRYSLENPDIYIQSNIVGFFNILEACRHFPVKFLLYASSSSVYGNNKKVPFNENDNVDNPISLYAATKKSNELLASTYHYNYDIHTTGLRFFTVYGPWGRPDMAVYKFTEAILNNQPIQVYGKGRLLRDFTFIDDIINGIIGILLRMKQELPPPLLNIGNNNPIEVLTLISEIEKCLNKKAKIEFLPIQMGDVERTFADIEVINSYSGFRPQTNLSIGIKRFCNWYLQYSVGKN